MAYSPYSAVNAIYKLKGQWDDADKAGDAAAKNNTAAKAQQYYNQLRSNGYGDVADQLSASNYIQAKSINDKWAKMGKTPTRDYLYTLGQSRGMSQNDVDKLISWDNQTGEVSFGGKKIGTPDTVVDGVSYWSDTSVLDNAFSDYINRSGTVRSNPAMISQENEKLFAKYNQEYEDLKNTNPFETEEGKAILAKYDLAGLQGRDNAVASNAGSNGGNIDSFAAANALRQQSALVNQGQMTALAAHQQKLDHARALLSDMGVNIDRVFNQDETAKNNDVARKSEIASVTGEVPIEWTLKNDPFYREFIDENGSLKEEYKNKDFQFEINKAKEKGDMATAEKYAVLRGMKLAKYFDEFKQYANEGDVAYLSAKPTEPARQFNESMKYNYDILEAEQADNLANAVGKASGRVISSGGSSSKSSSKSTTKPTLTAAQARDALESGVTTQDVLDAYDYWYGEGAYDLFMGGVTGNKDAPMTAKQVQKVVDDLNKRADKELYVGITAIDKNGVNSYKKGSADADWTIQQIFGSDSLTQEQKEYLVYDKFGFTENQVHTAKVDSHYSPDRVPLEAGGKK